MSDAIAVKGTRRAMRELADGTISVRIDIDPPYRKDFLRLFPEIDAVVALTPLRETEIEDKALPVADPTGLRAAADFATAASKKAEHTPSKRHFPPGLTGLAVMWCNDADFETWASTTYPDAFGDVGNSVKNLICYECQIESRKDLDTDPAAAAIFEEMFRKPYQAYLAAKA